MERKETRKPARPACRARLKYLQVRDDPDGIVRLLCGRPSCPGMLGEAQLSGTMTAESVDACFRGDAASPITRTWMVWPGHGAASAKQVMKSGDHYYRGFADTGYRVIRRKKGRRPMRAGMNPGHWTYDLWSKGIRGQTITLPALIFCPVCNTLNDVPAPDLPQEDD